MSNEVPNRSHAGFVLQLFPGGDPEIPAGSWGIEVSSLERLAGATGAYIIRLSRPVSGVLNADVTGFSAQEGFVMASVLGISPRGVVELSPELGTPAPVAGQLLQLPLILVTLFDDNGDPVDGEQTINIEVRRSPQD